MATVEVQSPVPALKEEIQAPAPAHKELLSKENFVEALQTKEKYVLIYAYIGEVSPQAEEAARRHAHNTDAWKVDVEKFPTAKENLKLMEFPAVVVFKDGKEIKRAEGLNPEKAKEVAAVLV